MPTTTNPRRIRINPTARPLVEEVTWDDLDPAERAVAEEVLTGLKAEFAVAAAATTDDETTPFGRFLATRAPAARTAVRARVRSLQAAPAAVLAENFGRHVELARPVVVNPAHRPRLKFDLPPELEAKIKAAIAKKKAEKAAAEAAAKAAADDLAAGLKYKRMRLTITKVACEAESGEWSPSDEFSMGGQFIDPFGKVTQVGEFEVMTDADAGETVHPNRVFADWKLHTGDTWPKVYIAVLAAAEKDDGGFAKFLRELWEKVKEKATLLIAAGLGALVGTEIMPVLGTIIGAVVGVVAAWIISLFDNPDDFMPTRTLKMTLAAASKSYYDWAKLTSAAGWPSQVTFGEDGSRYRVDLSWKVSTA